MFQSTISISFTSGVDATAVLKPWQILPRHGSIFGGSYPNHCFGGWR